MNNKSNINKTGQQMMDVVWGKGNLNSLSEGLQSGAAAVEIRVKNSQKAENYSTYMLFGIRPKASTSYSTPQILAQPWPSLLYSK